MGSGIIRSSYRPDIDGLRALAVLPVVLFHAQLSIFSGGYVGVDIFFVISGFLITGIIAREIDEQKFSILRFYERRARRILPALFAMLVVVLALASLLFFPGDFEDVPPSAAASLMFAANLWFFTQSGYFQGDAEEMPLLHTWSLGVEEQFYIIFPIILIILARYVRQRRTQVVWALAILSFAAAWYKQADTDSAAFYMLPTRMWELLAGSLLALGAIPEIRGKWARELGAGAGIAAILLPVFLYDKSTVFPGIAALPPVLGAAAIIHLAPNTKAGAALSAAPLVWLGLISYSLYLWHWPLIVFMSYFQDAALTPSESLIVVPASILIASASVKWIETPFRNTERFSQKAIISMSAAGMAFFAIVCAALIALGPWEGRFSSQVLALTDAAHDVSPAQDKCLTSGKITAEKLCNLGADVTPNAMIWGDSHAVEYAWVLGEKQKADNKAIAQRSIGSCPPLIGFNSPGNSHCAENNNAVLEELAQNQSISTVYLAAFWASPEYAGKASGEELRNTIKRLSDLGKKVVLIGATPRQNSSVPRALAHAMAYGLAPPETASEAAYRRETAWFSNAVLGLKGTKNLSYIDPAKFLISNGQSRIIDGKTPLYYDSHHLSLSGARRVLAQGAVNLGTQ